MRTETITKTYYTIKELSPEAQERAHEKYLRGGWHEYFWVDDGLDSVRAYAAFYGGELKDWSLSPYAHSYITVKFDPEYIADMPNLDPPEFLTGYCVDETFKMSLAGGSTHNTADPSFALAKLCGVGDVMRGEHMVQALERAVDACMESILRDMECQDGLEYFIDHAEVNGCEFTEDGDLV